MRRGGRIIDCSSDETTAREATGARQGLEAKFADSKLGRITHLDDTYLIHMNGRVYDYRLGRFLSVDPIISNPANSQSINPYSYIGNNPLSGTDPTGYGPCIKGEACAPDQQGIINSINAAISSGAITAKTAMEDVAAKAGAGLSAGQGALAA